MDVALRTVAPLKWTVCFHPQSNLAWVNRIPGRFKHVSAYAYAREFGLYLHYDIKIAHTQITPCRDALALMEFIRGCDCVEMPTGAASRPQLAFYCVPAIKHLLGIRCVVLRPDGLYRYCLQHGGRLIYGLNPVASPGHASD